GHAHAALARRARRVRAGASATRLRDRARSRRRRGRGEPVDRRAARPRVARRSAALAWPVLSEAASRVPWRQAAMNLHAGISVSRPDDRVAVVALEGEHDLASAQEATRTFE